MRARDDFQRSTIGSLPARKSVVFLLDNVDQLIVINRFVGVETQAILADASG